MVACPTFEGIEQVRDTKYEVRGDAHSYLVFRTLVLLKVCYCQRIMRPQQSKVDPEGQLVAGEPGTD